MATQVLIAFDKFKDALSASEACAIAAQTLAEMHPTWSLDLCPITDGGDGFCSVLSNRVGAEIRTVSAPGPRLETRCAPLGLVAASRLPAAARDLLRAASRGREFETIGVVEMAAISGLALVPSELRDPWTTSTRGTGVLIRAARELGADAVVLGIGGSATSDLGLGALQALGLELLDASQRPMDSVVPADWANVTALGGTIPPDLPPIIIAADVRNPLLGPQGATAIFAPQKGLPSTDIPRMEAAATRMARLLCDFCGRDHHAETMRPGAGAAGGLGFGLSVAAGAQIVSGSQLVAAWLDLHGRIDRADIVLTGEGCWDSSSLSGKGPGAIVQRARTRKRRVVVMAGAFNTTECLGASVHAITPVGTPLVDALTCTGVNLANAVRRVFR